MRTWVLLRGLARQSGHWGGFVDALLTALPGDRIVTLDLPGTGRHRNLPSPLRVEHLLAHCRDQLRACGEQPPFHVIGMSLGGMVTAAWLTEHAEDLAGAVLINSSLRPLNPWHQRLRPGAWWPLLCSLLARDPQRSESLILQLTSNRPEQRRRVLAHWTMLRREQAVSTFDSLRQLWAAARFRLHEGTPKPPVLLLCSRGDRLVHPDCSRALVRRWQCVLAEHPDAGHDLSLDDADWVVARIVQQFGSARQDPPAV